MGCKGKEAFSPVKWFSKNLWDKGHNRQPQNWLKKLNLAQTTINRWMSSILLPRSDANPDRHLNGILFDRIYRIFYQSTFL